MKKVMKIVSDDHLRDIHKGDEGSSRLLYEINWIVVVLMMMMRAW